MSKVTKNITKNNRKSGYVSYYMVECDDPCGGFSWNCPVGSTAITVSVTPNDTDGCHCGKVRYTKGGVKYSLSSRGTEIVEEAGNSGCICLGAANGSITIYPDEGTSFFAWNACAEPCSESARCTVGGNATYVGAQVVYDNSMTFGESQTIEINSVDSGFSSYKITGPFTINGKAISPDSAGSKTFRVTLSTSLGSIYGDCVVTVSKANQSISYNGPSECVIGTTYVFSAVSTSGGAVSVAFKDSTSGIIIGNSFVISKSGIHTLVLTQSGDSNYLSVSKEVTVLAKKKDQIITYTGPKDFIVGAEQLLSAQSNVGLSNFIYNTTTVGVQIVGNVLVSLKTGLISVDVIEQGNDEYNAITTTVVLVCGIDNFNPVLIATNSNEIASGGVWCSIVKFNSSNKAFAV